jgi:hypothetical protein
MIHVSFRLSLAKGKSSIETAERHARTRITALLLGDDLKHYGGG